MNVIEIDEKIMSALPTICLYFGRYTQELYASDPKIKQANLGAILSSLNFYINDLFPTEKSKVTDTELKLEETIVTPIVQPKSEITTDAHKSLSFSNFVFRREKVQLDSDSSDSDSSDSDSSDSDSDLESSQNETGEEKKKKREEEKKNKRAKEKEKKLAEEKARAEQKEIEENARREKEQLEEKLAADLKKQNDFKMKQFFEELIGLFGTQDLYQEKLMTDFMKIIRELLVWFVSVGNSNALYRDIMNYFENIVLILKICLPVFR